MKQNSLYRILDANLNRLREGVRVVEEYFRFLKEDEECAYALKNVRHNVRNIEEGLSRKELLQSRESATDMFSEGMVANEGERESIDALVIANLKRAQEAARVLEEYLKVSSVPQKAEVAKEIRFALYGIEKVWGVNE